MQAATQGLPPPVWQRRLLAVLVADCAGYSRLMEADELGTHTRMRSLRVGVIDPCVVTYRGEIVKNTGDGFLACFESPLDAARCAVSLQHQIAQREADHPPESRIAFRMGLNVEDIIVEQHDVFGAGVNASR